MKLKDNTLKIIYIAGNGHSGSTLLDIIMGSSPKIFSAGELAFITRDIIFEEYCSCGDVIQDCYFWQKVIEKWLAVSPATFEEYKVLRWRYERSKTTLNTLWNHFFPSQSFLKYCSATLALFKAIQEVSGKSVIIDSTKAPQRIAVLNRIADVKVVHICRNAKGVLNSAKHTAKKDIAAGVEVDSPARRTSKTLIEWVFVNFITELFCIGVKSGKLYYKKYIQDLKSLEKVDDSIKISTDTFSTPHMIAGNVIRLKKGIKLNSDLGFKYSRLTKKQLRLAGMFDILFPFWS